jgi:hypothetical protein
MGGFSLNSQVASPLLLRQEKSELKKTVVACDGCISGMFTTASAGIIFVLDEPNIPVFTHRDFSKSKQRGVVC